MWSLDRDPHPLRFYVRRAFRIYPLWLVVLFLSVAVQLPTSPADAPHFAFFHAGRKELLENATLTFNWFAGARLIGASWSLPIEVQMYVVLPFIYFFMRSYRRLWPLLVLDAVAMFTSRSMEPAISSTLVFCTPLFLPGAMAYILYKHTSPRLPSWTFAVWLFSLVFFLNLYAARTQDSFRIGWLFTLLIGMSLPLFHQIRWQPLCRATHLIARYSYGIYLCHFAAIAVAVHYLRAYNIAIRTGSFFLTLTVLSIGFYHAVEKPMIGFGSKIAKRLESGPEPPFNEQMLSIEPAL